MAAWRDDKATMLSSKQFSGAIVIDSGASIAS